MLKTKCKILLIFTLLLFFLGFLPQISKAAECSYGTLYTWYSEDGLTWKNSTVDNIIGKLGEPFFVKASIKAKIDLKSIDIKIWETGETNSEDSSYQLIKGPDCYFTFYDIMNVQKNDTYSYVWKFKVKQETEWVNGNAPLNILIQFDKNDYDNKILSFTIVNMYIIDEIWEDNTKNNTQDNVSGYELNSMTQNIKTSPDFKLSTITLVLILIILYAMKKVKNS